MKRIFEFLRSPLIVITLGILCIALLVWFAGPLLAFADWRPLESAIARTIAIVALLILWLGKRVVQAIRQRQANRRLLAAMSAGDATPPPDMGNAAQLEEIRRRFAKAMSVMRDSQLGESRSPLSRLFGARRYAYQLPWYLFVGPPGSGKTTALLNAGLQFPLASELGTDPIRGVGGTRQCDWWFTDQAVMIDTAGRYTTQDSDALADASEWQAFLAALKRYRPRQPINGAIVTVSISDLLELSATERRAQASAVRARLGELLTTLDNTFPIYLLITKADLIAGFMEFFADLDREARDQVWGVTFDYLEGGPGIPPADALARELDQLIARIDSLTLDRLQAERDPARRAAIQGFANQIAALRGALLDYLGEAFPPTKLARQPVLRGFYFTSGTQEGSPIDRVMGSLARQFGLQRRMLPALRPSGRAFFLSRLLSGVIFPEAGLAGTNLRWERRMGTLKWAASIAALVGAIGSTLGWTWSYFNNAAYLADVSAQAEGLKQELAGQVAGSLDIRRLLPLYERVQRIANTERVDPQAPALSYTWGLFQGGKLGAAADQAYHRLLAQTLAPLLAERLAGALRQGGANPVLQYENLKAYVMLREPDRLDAAALRGWVAFDLAAQRSGGLSPEDQRALLRHVDAMLTRGAFQDRVTADNDLIVQARAALSATPFPQRVYERLKRQGVGDIAEYKLLNSGGPATASAFARTSGQPLSSGVSGFFTYNGYHKGFVPQLDETIKVLAAEEVWVLGLRDSENARRAADSKARDTLIQAVKRLYLLDYAETWERFIGDVTLKRGANLAETIAIARLLSAPDSPVMPVMRSIVREVSLTETAAGNVVGQAVGKATEALQGTKEKLEKLLGPVDSAPTVTAPQRIESLVDDRFESLRRQIRPPEGGGPAPLERSLALVNELYQHLLATDQAGREGRPPPPSDAPLKIKAESGRLPEPLRSMLSALVAGGSAQASGATREVLGKQVAALGEACNRLIGGRYPLVRDSSRDVTPEDFSRVFAAGSGLLDEFFQKNLAALVDNQVKPWRFRDPAMGDSAALRQFQNAAEIRDVFFGAGKVAQIRVEFRPLELDPGFAQLNLNVDGQELRYQSGPPVPKSMQWPGPGGTNQVRLQLSGKDGRESQLLFEGPWALFRMFDRAQIEASNQPEKFRAIFTLDGKRVQFDITASSVRNPLRLPELQAFQCPRQF